MGLVLALAVFLGFSSHLSTPYEVTLLDTTREDELGWQTFSGGGGQEWTEISWNTDSGETRRSYTVCNVDAQGVNNWLRMPYLSRGDANHLYIEIKFTIRNCKMHIDVMYMLNCEDSFKLLYYEAASDLANATMPTWDGFTYTSLGAMKGHYTFTDRADYSENTVQREMSITQNVLGHYYLFLI